MAVSSLMRLCRRGEGFQTYRTGNNKLGRIGARGVALGLIFGLLAAGALAQSPVLLERKANRTLKIPETPPSGGFLTETAFGSLRFTDPVVITAPPGETNRLFVVEQVGRIIVITNLVNPTRSIFMDIDARVSGGVPSDERGLLGLAFHPGYSTNRLFFVFYTATSGSTDRLSRFEAAPNNPNQGLPDSEVVLINQRDDAGNHNGGDLHFGPDGYLYVSLGDEGGANDQYDNSQRINRDFFAGILRIDVDKRSGSLPPNSHVAASANYAVPPDNPFVGASTFNGLPVDPGTVRTEFWAVGLRNPWRMSFDRPSGRLYVGDVGQGAREEIDVIVKGGNYGWNYREGNIAGPRRTPPEGFVAIDPIYDYGRRDGLSVTGGVVYRGDRFPEIFAHYIFADYGTGNIWALGYDAVGAVNVRRLAGDSGITAFGVDPSNGDVLFADNGEDRIKRLVASPNVTGTPIPTLLSETGAFSDLESLKPSEGIVPYELNVPFWSDHALKTRWFAVRDSDRKIGFDRGGNWAFPSGMVWIKHFELELTRGVSESARRLETRFLVRNTNGVYGITYRWNDAQNDAALVPEEGFDETFTINDRGIPRTQVWHYPSRSQCLACHTPEAGYALGFRTSQLNRDHDFGDAQGNQIRALSDAGYFETRVEDIHTLPSAAAADDSSQSLEYRVRSYLAANCSQCHQPGGPGLGVFDARLTTATSEAGLVNGDLLNRFGNSNVRVTRPGAPDQSMLLRRIATLGSGRMPPLASSVLDQAAIELVAEWISSDLTKFQSFTEWQTEHFGSIDAPEASATADPDADGTTNLLEYLAGRNPNSSADSWKVSIQRAGDAVHIQFPKIANRSFEIQVATDLFSPAPWRPMNHPGNKPFFPAQDSVGVFQDLIVPGGSIFYRVRIATP